VLGTNTGYYPRHSKKHVLILKALPEDQELRGKAIREFVDDVASGICRDEANLQSVESTLPIPTIIQE
jgi:ketopantoate hydroxymethyltransferase